MSDIILLDGGMGQELVRRSDRPATPLWSADVMLKDPDLVRNVHADFIQAGAQVITLNTYSATPQRLAMQNARDLLEPLHRAAMHAAKEAIEQTEKEGIRIAACLPPLVASYRPDTAPAFDESVDTYRRLVELQSESDIILCETMASIHEARAATTAAKETGKPVWVGFTVSDEQTGTLRSGETVSDALHEVQALGVDAVLLNCSQPEAISASWAQLKEANIPFGAYANGFSSVAPLQPGGTVEHLEKRHDFSPEEFTRHAIGLVKAGASIIGGCCEVSPAHIKELHNALTATLQSQN